MTRRRNASGGAGRGGADVSPVGGGAGEPRWALGHALAGVDDEAVEVGQVHPGAELGRDAAPALEAVGAGGAVGDAAPLVVVVHAGGAGRGVGRRRAAAQALRVAALPRRRARPPCARLGAFLRERERQREREELHTCSV